VTRIAIHLTVSLLLAPIAAYAATAKEAESKPSTQPSTRPSTQPSSRPATQPATQPASKPASQPTSQPESQPATKPAEEVEAEKPKDRYLLVTGGEVHSVTGPVFARTNLVCKNGKISAIGPNAVLPEGLEDVEVVTLDASGKRVYPGLIAVESGGIIGSEPPGDTTDVFSLNMTIALAGGITTTVTGNTAGKLTFGTLEDQLLKESLFVNLAYSSDQPAAKQSLRADFDKVRQYVRDLEAYELAKKEKPDTKEPDKSWLKGKMEEYLNLLQGRRVAIASANQVHEILDLCNLAETYGFKLVIRGAQEGWIVAPVMSRAGASAIISTRPYGFRSGGPIPEDLTLNRTTGWSITNAAKMHDYGVHVAIVPSTSTITVWGLAGRDLLHLNMEAAFAVRGGLSNDAALETITIGAARILGIDHRVGSIEVGKDADLVVCDGDILHYMTQVHHTIVNGRVAYHKLAESLFSHIRPEGGLESPPPDDYWPRRLGADVDSNGVLTR
jgi:hypothetical protein